jgi:hypothetical protein
MKVSRREEGRRKREEEYKNHFSLLPSPFFLLSPKLKTLKIEQYDSPTGHSGTENAR